VDGVRTLGVDNLLWRREEDEPERLSGELCNQLWRFRRAADELALTRDRAKIFHWQREVRRDAHDALEQHFKTKVGQGDAHALGLNPAKGFEVHTTRFALRVGPDGQLLSQAIVALLQEDHTRPLGNANFESGATVIADLAAQKVRYVIRKSAGSKQRFEQQRDYALAVERESGGSTYFRAGTDEPFAALHDPKGGF
jgi:hypothetical protein